MSIMDWAAWCVIIGLSSIAIGGLLIWAYGDAMKVWTERRPADDSSGVIARKQFTGVLIYSMVMIVVGLGSLVQGTLYVLAK